MTEVVNPTPGESTEVNGMPLGPTGQTRSGMTADALRAWAMTQGHEVIGRPFENYVNGVDAAFTADGEYEVFWTVKQ